MVLYRRRNTQLNYTAFRRAAKAASSNRIDVDMLMLHDFHTSVDTFPYDTYNAPTPMTGTDMLDHLTTAKNFLTTPVIKDALLWLVGVSLTYETPRSSPLPRLRVRSSTRHTASRRAIRSQEVIAAMSTLFQQRTRWCRR